jgi:hypothetical protein
MNIHLKRIAYGLPVCATIGALLYIGAEWFLASLFGLALAYCVGCLFVSPFDAGSKSA